MSGNESLIQRESLSDYTDSNANMSDLKRKLLNEDEQDKASIPSGSDSTQSTGSVDNLPVNKRAHSNDSAGHASHPNENLRNIDPALITLAERHGYTIQSPLGKGSYGLVVLARCRGTDETVAIKCVGSIFANTTTARRLLREIRILRTLDHPNLVGFRGLLMPDNMETFSSQCLVFEFVDTDLQRLIQSQQFFTLLHVQFLTYQQLLGVRYLHNHGLIHRDLKPANVLVNANCTLKVCDFGLSRRYVRSDDYAMTAATTTTAVGSNNSGGGIGSTGISSNVGTSNSVSSNNTDDGLNNITGIIPDNLVVIRDVKDIHSRKKPRMMTKHVVTRWYRAPELVLLAQKYSTAIDMWACGCILAELLTMLPSIVSKSSNRQPLFPGSSCYPQSADESNNTEQLDQLHAILNVVGCPSDDEMDRMSLSAETRQILRRDKYPTNRLNEMYASADADALDLLQKLLKFVPEDRPTADEALNHPFFSSLSNKDILDDDYIEERWYGDKDDEEENIDMQRAMIVEQVLVDYPYASVKWSDVSYQALSDDSSYSDEGDLRSGNEDNYGDDEDDDGYSAYQQAILSYQRYQVEETAKFGNLIAGLESRAVMLPSYTPTEAFLRLLKRRFLQK